MCVPPALPVSVIAAQSLRSSALRGVKDTAVGRWNEKEISSRRLPDYLKQGVGKQPTQASCYEQTGRSTSRNTRSKQPLTSNDRTADAPPPPPWPLLLALLLDSDLSTLACASSSSPPAPAPLSLPTLVPAPVFVLVPAPVLVLVPAPVLVLLSKAAAGSGQVAAASKNRAAPLELESERVLVLPVCMCVCILCVLCLAEGVVCTEMMIWVAQTVSQGTSSSFLLHARALLT